MKVLVKQKAADYTFEKLFEKKKQYSKLKDLSYSSFQFQSYLKDSDLVLNVSCCQGTECVQTLVWGWSGFSL